MSTFSNEGTVHRVTVKVAWTSELETELKLGHSIQDIQVKAGLAGSPCPDLGYLLQATEKEGLLAVAIVGSVVVCHL